MDVLKDDDVIKKSRDLDYYRGVFERSYVVPHSCQVS